MSVYPVVVYMLFSSKISCPSGIFLFSSSVSVYVDENCPGTTLCVWVCTSCGGVVFFSTHMTSFFTEVLVSLIGHVSFVTVVVFGPSIIWSFPLKIFIVLNSVSLYMRSFSSFSIQISISMLSLSASVFVSFAA